jgi:hypothetical protein
LKTGFYAITVVKLRFFKINLKLGEGRSKSNRQLAIAGLDNYTDLPYPGSNPEAFSPYVSQFPLSHRPEMFMSNLLSEQRSDLVNRMD